VNTRHHQAVRDLAPALRATAWAEDGVLEAAESRDPGAWVLAVQWHPEDEPDDRLFRGFAGALG
jgi:putative glutamine amidotransferase